MNKIKLLIQYIRTNPNIETKDLDAFISKINQIHSQGLDHLHFIADFDFTMTQFFHLGNRSMSSHSIINKSTFCSQQVKDKLSLLFSTFHPFEINHDITVQEKTEKMIEWWTKEHEILVSLGLTRKDLEGCVDQNPVTFRPFLKELIDLATDLNVPFLVFSAGLGDVIEIVLKKAGLFTRDMAIVSNRMEFSQDKIVGFKDPLIHTLNKNEAAMDGEHYDKVKDRDNVILMGDSIGDLHMADGIPHKTKLTVGFLNTDVDKLRDLYLQKFDIVLTNDTTLETLFLLLQVLQCP
ncbi:hypothetical protein HDV06_006139 [Boothiomyces sp. JEL0866]|nr:hypothetical protein HDV06_006139 [Boothiomyces sp. JEL0866]